MALLLLGLAWSNFAVAQSPMPLKVIPLDKDTAFLEKEFSYNSVYVTDFQLQNSLEQLLQKLWQKGYLGATIDSLQQDTVITTAWLHVGEQYEWLQLENGNVNEGFLSHIGYRERLYQKKPFNYRQVLQLQDRLLTYSENHGYPFATVRLDSFTFKDNQVGAKLFMDKQQQFLFDSIKINGEGHITKTYLYNYLGIRPGALYSEAQVRKIPTRIKEIPFLEEEQSLNVAFQQEKAVINLYLQNRKASKLNFLIGFLPNNQVTGKLLITGEANLRLHNSFGAGELLDLEWRQLKARTSNLDLVFNYPYLPFLPFGADFKFHIYRNDTIFQEAAFTAGAQYNFIGGNYIKAYVNNQQLNLLTVDTSLVKSTKSLPDKLDINKNFYGLEYHFQRLDYRLNPTRGVVLNLSGQIGKREIRKNAQITELVDQLDPKFDFETLYDSIPLVSTQYQIGLTLEKFWKLGPRSTVKTGSRGAVLAGEKIFDNELYRIGGNSLLRGFDEQAILATWYNVFTAEYRFLLGQNSYTFLFTDWAYYEKQADGFHNPDRPFGFGAGITFETKAGVFALSYALGRQRQNPIELRSAKIHFGYVNYF